MFGNAVTEFTKSAEGSYGYTLKIDTTAARANKISQVQAQVSSVDTPEPVTSEVSVAIIEGYLNDSECPDLAFHFGNGEVIVFFKTSVFPYVATTRFALFGLRNSQACTQDSDLLDCPDADLDLVKSYVLKEAYAINKLAVPKDILDTIRTEEARVRAE